MSSKREVTVLVIVHRFQQESGPILEQAGSTWLSTEDSARLSGSPRARHRQDAQEALGAAHNSNHRADKPWHSADELQEQQAAELVHSLQQLEQVIVAGESLCRQGLCKLAQCLPGCLSVCLPACLPDCLHICLSVD